MLPADADLPPGRPLEQTLPVPWVRYLSPAPPTLTPEARTGPRPGPGREIKGPVRFPAGELGELCHCRCPWWVAAKPRSRHGAARPLCQDAASGQPGFPVWIRPPVWPPCPQDHRAPVVEEGGGGGREVMERRMCQQAFCRSLEKTLGLRKAQTPRMQRRLTLLLWREPFKSSLRL